MNLLTILQEAGIDCPQISDREVTGVTEIIGNVKEGSIFVAVKGDRTDGNSYIDEAFRKGAAAVVTDTAVNKNGQIIKTDDSRKSAGLLSSAFYCRPEKKITLIGITGTNGKTTTAFYIKHLLESIGEKCGIIGTLGCGFGENFTESGYTTPLPEELFRELSLMRDSGVKYCVTEVSSQALSQKRIYPLKFSLGVLTNIGHDHLDYHKSIENYVSAKTELFRISEKALINADDAYCGSFQGLAGDTKTYSFRTLFSDFTGKNITERENGTSYIFLESRGYNRVFINGKGDIPLYNSLAAVSSLCMLGFSSEKIIPALRSLPAIKGRMQKISGGTKTAYIDFAHTPDALYAVLSSLRKTVSGKLICVFGCGGERDKLKRSLMGSVSSQLSDIVIVTTDNPRGEDPVKISDDIYKGIKNKKNTFNIPDREEAIAFAVGLASEGDIILVAGKGHENYQLIGGRKIYFSDEEILKKYLH